MGDTLDTTGLVVTATYVDNSTKTLETSEYTLSVVDMTTAGSKSVTVTLKEDESITITFNVEVIKVYEHKIDLSGTAKDTTWKVENTKDSKVILLTPQGIQYKP